MIKQQEISLATAKTKSKTLSKSEKPGGVDKVPTNISGAKV